MREVPGAIRAMMLMNSRIDVLPTLKAVRVPTLVLHRRGDMIVPTERACAGVYDPGGDVHRVSRR